MIPWRLDRIAEAVQGVVRGAATDLDVTCVVTDSRDCVPGALFVAIPGERVNGHDFVDQARDRGAVATLASQPVPGPAVMVDDTVAALGLLAAAYRDSLEDVTVLALTGSSGKTTTKDLLAAVLSAVGPTIAPRGSYNSEVGLPLTILECDADTRYLVLEMGMRGFGHIDYLCRIGRPDIAGLINVGSAHVGMVGSREGIAQAKGEILDRLPATGHAILHADNPLVMAQASRTSARVMTFGESESSDVRITHVHLDQGAQPSFDLVHEGMSVHVDLRLAGEHQTANAAAAAAMALAAGVSLSTVAEVLNSVRPRSKWRMEVHHRSDGVTLINDSYNANPESMRAALKALVAMGEGRRTWAVLGAMGELGDESLDEHDALGRMVVRLDVSKLIAVGEQTRPLYLGASLEGSWGDEATWVESQEEALEILRRELAAGDVVLVKASRSVGLDRLAAALLEEERT